MWLRKWIGGELGGERMAWVIESPKTDDVNGSWERAGVVAVEAIGTLTLRMAAAVADRYFEDMPEILRTMAQVSSCAWDREVTAKIPAGWGELANVYQTAGFRYVSDTSDGMMLFEWRDKW